MTSINDEIQVLFSWNPPRLRVNPAALAGKTPSKSTRQPAFYDKHFSEKLVLRHVKRLPSLAQDLAANVDRALLAASKTLPPVDGFITAKDRERGVRHVGKTIRDEKGVTNFYDKITAPFCMPLASTLALHPKASTSDWNTLLLWTQSVSSSGYAIMDGELQIMPAEEDYHEMSVGTMEHKTRHILEEIRNSGAPFATWEMTSPFAGPPEVMDAVPNLGGFSWTFCTDPNCHTDKKHIKERQKVSDVKVGNDALTPPWNLEDAPSDIPVDPWSAPLSEGSSEIPQRPVKRRISAASSSMAPRPMPMLDVRLGKASSGTPRGERLNPPTAPVSASLPPPPTPTSEKDKDREMDDDEEKEEDKDEEMEEDKDEETARIGKRKSRPGDDDEDHKYRHDLTAHRHGLVQQAWARAVRVDGTIIVLHSGNHELVCLRHRATQTLYVSDLIEPSTCEDPGYGKLQVGIYVAAVQDTMDRMGQRLHSSPPKSSDDDDGNDLAGGDNTKDDRGDDWDSGSGHEGDQGRGKDGRGDGGRGNPGGSGCKGGEFQAGAGRKDARVDGLDTEVFCPNFVNLHQYQKTIQAANTRCMLLLYLQYGVYDSPIPASFIRSAPPIVAKAPPRSKSTHTPNDSLTIVLTSEIGWGATGVAHRGTLKLTDMDRSVPLDVVVKLAFDSEQQVMLKNEYESCRHLRSKDVLRGITVTLGLFDDTEGGPSALVMLYAGDSVVDVPERVLSASDCKSALSTLASIHGAGMLHGDIRWENIVVSDSGVTIIDFSHAEHCDDQKVMDKEYAHLLFLASSKTVDGIEHLEWAPRFPRASTLNLPADPQSYNHST